MFQSKMSHHDERPTFQSLPALLIGRVGRRLLRQEESLRRPGEEADPGRSVPAELAVRVSRRGRGFRPPNLAPASPPRVREPSPPRAPTPPRHEPSLSPSLTSWPSYSPLSARSQRHVYPHCLDTCSWRISRHRPSCHSPGCSKSRYRRIELAEATSAAGIVECLATAGWTASSRACDFAACAAVMDAPSPRAHCFATIGAVAGSKSWKRRGSSCRSYR